MALTPDDRRAFLELLPALGPGADRAPVQHFVDAHLEACLDEVVADPGFDQVRCGLLRALAERLPADELEAVRHQALGIVDGFAEVVASGDATLTLARHPAWVGLCRLEAIAAPDDADVDAAVGLATAGFTQLTGSAPAEGDVLWALAEAADEVAWTGRAAELLERAADAPFTEPHDRSRVRLLRALARLEHGDPTAAELLEEIARSTEAPDQSRAHAWWVLAALARQDGDTPLSRSRLRQARELVDPEDEAVLARIDEALATP
jgi:hypothetical protein